MRPATGPDLVKTATGGRVSLEELKTGRNKVGRPPSRLACGMAIAEDHAPSPHSTTSVHQAGLKRPYR